MWRMSLLYVVHTGVVSDFFLCVCIYKGGGGGGGGRVQFVFVSGSWIEITRYYENLY